MASTYLSECGGCGNSATMKCFGCMEAPQYLPGDSVGTVYCNRNCQKAHWPEHKVHCRMLGQRKKLLRTANVLKVAMLTYREVIYDVDLTKVEFQEGVLRLYQNQRAITAPTKRGIFPDHLTTNTEFKEAALANNQCTTAMALLGPLTLKLLQGTVSTIELLDLHIGKPLFSTNLVPGPDSSGVPHTVLKVRRFSANEAWIIDTTGCQYGFRDVLVPYGKYIEDYACRSASEPTTYDATETKDLDHFLTLPFMNKTRAQRENRQLERQARLHFAEFNKTRVSKDILGGSVTEFQDKLDGFADELKSHMLKM